MTGPAEHPQLIAVLDDEATQRVSLSRLLRVHGYQTALFADGPSLLKAHQVSPFSCIILDLQLTGMNGFTVLEKLALPAGSARVVVVTAQDLDGCLDRARTLGAFTCIAKPIEQKPLLNAIEGKLES